MQRFAVIKLALLAVPAFYYHYVSNAIDWVALVTLHVLCATAFDAARGRYAEALLSGLVLWLLHARSRLFWTVYLVWNSAFSLQLWPNAGQSLVLGALHNLPAYVYAHALPVSSRVLSAWAILRAQALLPFFVLLLFARA